MLKTLARFTSSFAALLSDQKTVIDADGRIEDIRSAMLDELSALQSSTASSAIWASIARAVDFQTLWYTRSDLFGVLADHLGEEVAREKINAITEMFRGLVADNFLIASAAGQRNRTR